jgi:hypothetical protein
MGSVPSEAGPVFGVDRQVDAGTPTQALDVARHRFDLYGVIDAGHPLQLLVDPEGFQSPLCR